MRWENIVNPEQVRKTLSILKPDGQAFEVRIISTGKKKIISGYFRDADTLLKEFDSVDLRGKNIYITLNALKDELYSREQHDRFLQTSLTTSDNDVAAYNWLFIDVDPVRSAGISSSEEELRAATDLSGKIYRYMDNLGFEEPVKAMSGNGCHLLYKIDMQNTPENVELVKKCLSVLSILFDTDQVHVDTSNYNPARICKLHGTLAQKGASTQDRPHRFSRIFTNVVDVKTTQRPFLEKLAKQIPDTQQPEHHRTYQPQFNLVDFLNRNGLRYKEQRSSRATIYSLEVCPFDSSHTNGDAKVFEYHDNGAIAFKCHHNSCSGYKWQDVRKKYEPDAYEFNRVDDRIQRGYEQHNRYKQEQIPYTEISTPLPENGSVPENMFRTAEQILQEAEPDHEFIHTGISLIDEKMLGFEKSCVTVLSGLRGSGKSTLLGQIMLTAINEGHTVVCYSGELSNRKYLNWLYRQAAGKHGVEQGTTYQGGYGVRPEVQDKITEWFGEYFWLYNNKFGNRFDLISQYLRQKLKETKADLCVIDNLMALDLQSYDRMNKYDAQTKFVWELKNIAELSNTHVVFVAHPRKANGLLRLADISGSGNISNIVDNAFIIHRWNRDFENGFQEFFKEDAEKKIPRCTNVVEITKDREGGLQDEFIPLWYEERSKRLQNAIDENLIYCWADSADIKEEQIPLPDMPDEDPDPDQDQVQMELDELPDGFAYMD